jgi:hypothetical protein
MSVRETSTRYLKFFAKLGDVLKPAEVIKINPKSMISQS